MMAMVDDAEEGDDAGTEGESEAEEEEGGEKKSGEAAGVCRHAGAQRSLCGYP